MVWTSISCDLESRKWSVSKVWRELWTGGVAPAKNACVKSTAFQTHSSPKAVHRTWPCQATFVSPVSCSRYHPPLASCPSPCSVRLPPAFHQGFLDFPHLFLIVTFLKHHGLLPFAYTDVDWYKSDDYRAIDLMTLQPAKSLRMRLSHHMCVLPESCLLYSMCSAMGYLNEWIFPN